MLECTNYSLNDGQIRWAKDGCNDVAAAPASGSSTRQTPPHTLSRQLTASLQNLQCTTPTSTERPSVAVITVNALLIANRFKIQCPGIQGPTAVSLCVRCLTIACRCQGRFDVRFAGGNILSMISGRENRYRQGCRDTRVGLGYID